MDIHERILLARRRVPRLSQREAAARAGVAYSTWRAWEDGRTPRAWGVLSDVARVLGVTPNDLLGWADPDGGTRSPVGGVDYGDR